MSTDLPFVALTGQIRTPRNRHLSVAGSIHDDATASRLGFKGGTVAGSIHMDQFVPLLLEAFGPAWFQTGCLSLYFRTPTVDQEPVRTTLSPDPALPSGQLRARMETTAGATVAEGSASVGADTTGGVLQSWDLRPVNPSSLRILRNLCPGQRLGPVTTAASAERQEHLDRERLLTEPLPWYVGESPWGGPVASPSSIVDLLYTELLRELKEGLGQRVGLFGAIEVRSWQGPVFTGQPYEVSGEIVAVSESPKTESFWYDSEAVDPDGARVASMRMMLRSLKASSPEYS